MKKALVAAAFTFGVLVPGAFAYAATYNADNACSRSGGGTCTDSAGWGGTVDGPGGISGKESVLIDFSSAPDISTGDTITLFHDSHNNTCQYGFLFSPAPGYLQAWLDNTSYPGAGFTTPSVTQPTWDSNLIQYGGSTNPIFFTIGPVDENTRDVWNAHKQIQVSYDNGTYSGYGSCQAGSLYGWEDSYVEIDGGMGSGSFDPDCGKPIPGFGSIWCGGFGGTHVTSSPYYAGPATFTGDTWDPSETAFFTTIVDDTMGATGTERIPGCYIHEAAVTLDLFRGMTISGNVPTTTLNIPIPMSTSSIQITPAEIREYFPAWFFNMESWVRLMSGYSMWFGFVFIIWKRYWGTPSSGGGVG